MRPEINGVVQAANEVAGEGISANEAPRPQAVSAGSAEFERLAAERFTICQPALVPVPVAPPLTDKIFIFGEPVLKKYYTTFDWSGLRVGFAVAQNPLAPEPPLQV